MESAAAARLSPADERPLAERPDAPNWSENYCLQAFDPTLGLGVWLHSGLPVYDLDLWHDITVIYLPGGSELLLTKGFTPGGREHDIPGSMLNADYEEATGDWVWRFHGAATRATRQELAIGPLSERPTEPLRFELRYHGLAAVWDMTARMGGRSAFSNAHWEQACTVSGWIEYGGTRAAFDGSGIRDHSRGPRDFQNLGAHYWLCGQFPSGRAFGLVHVEPTSAHPAALSAAFLVRDGVLVDADVVAVPEDKEFAGPFEIALKGPDGEERVHGELVHDMPFTMSHPDQFLLGFRPGHRQNLLRDGQVRWTWDGETGYGLGERSVALDASGRPENR